MKNKLLDLLDDLICGVIKTIGVIGVWVEETAKFITERLE